MPRRTLRRARLYGIVDLTYAAPASLKRVVREMIAGGIDVIQLRAKAQPDEAVEKWARELLPLCRDGSVPLVINDSPAIAASIGADGVHVGQDDAATSEIRALVGNEMLVGRSTHSLEQADEAAADPGVDYIGFGPLFSTPTKPDYAPIGTGDIAGVHRAHPDLPVFCIGGIKKENLPEILAAGAQRAVIVSGILRAPDVEGYVREAKELLGGE